MLGEVADAADETAVTAFVERAQQEFGGLDVVYANAGRQRRPHAALRAERRALAGGSADEPDRAVPRDQARGAAR